MQGETPFLWSVQKKPKVIALLAAAVVVVVVNDKIMFFKEIKSLAVFGS